MVKKGFSHFHIGPIQYIQNEGWIHPSGKPSPLTTQRYQANQHQTFGGESICNVSKAPSVREVFGFKIPTIIGVLSKCEEDRKMDLTPDLLILPQLGTQILGGRS